MTRFILECTKTGRHWRYVSKGQCYRAAVHLGLKDYMIGWMKRPFNRMSPWRGLPDAVKRLTAMQGLPWWRPEPSI